MSSDFGSYQARGIEAGNDEVTAPRPPHPFLPFRAIGGTDLTGVDQLLMVICYFIWPDATPDEVRCFIFNNTEGDHLYSREDIIQRTNELQIFRQRDPTEAYQAFTPESLLRCQHFWTQPPPLGVSTVRRSQLVDFDEFGLELALGSDDKGRACSIVRAHKPGYYTRNTKATVLFAVEAGDPNVPDSCLGSVAKPRVWHRIFYQRGIDLADFSYFADFVCRDLEENPAPGGTDLHRIFTWGDRETYLTDLAYETVESRPSPNHFNVVVVPRYQPSFRPA